MKFEKMQGAGNDYIYINLFEERIDDPVSLAQSLSNRHFGVGGDGIVLIGPSEEADFSMRMFNTDGSEGAMCGNAARCVGKYVYERGLTPKTEIALKTLSGIKYLSLSVNRLTHEVELVRVDMGAALFTASDALGAQLTLPAMLDYPLRVDGADYRVTFVSMGNPHAVIFTEAIDTLPIEKIGPLLEFHRFFPQRTNVEFVEVVDPAHLKMRVWERGSGETLACGSGACASLVAGVLTGRCNAEASVQLRGGVLNVKWEREHNRVFLSGPARFVFKGEI